MTSPWETPPQSPLRRRLLVGAAAAAGVAGVAWLSRANGTDPRQFRIEAEEPGIAGDPEVDTPEDPDVSERPDDALGAWDDLGPLPVAPGSRIALAVGLGDRVLVLAGAAAGPEPGTREAVLLGGNGRSWDRVTPPPHPLPASALLLAAGHRPLVMSPGATAPMIADPTVRTWSALPSLAVPELRAGSADVRPGSVTASASHVVAAVGDALLALDLNPPEPRWVPLAVPAPLAGARGIVGGVPGLALIAEVDTPQVQRPIPGLRAWVSRSMGDLELPVPEWEEITGPPILSPVTLQPVPQPGGLVLVTAGGSSASALRRNGDRWVFEGVLASGASTPLIASGGGRMVTLTDGELRQRGPDRTWSRLPAPPLHPVAVALAARSVVVVGTRDGERDDGVIHGARRRL